MRIFASAVTAFCSALVAGSTPPSAALADAIVPAAVAQSDGYQKVFASVRHSVCGVTDDRMRSAMHVGAVALDRGATIYTITNGFDNLKCGLAYVAAVTADGHGSYRTILLQRGEKLDVFSDGEAAVSSGNMPGIVVQAFRYDGSVYRASDTCTFHRVDDVRFDAGASSQTVTGFLEYYPDAAYRVFARAGQALSIDVHPVGGAIPSVGITGRTCTSLVQPTARSWHGSVPYSGSFYIVVTRPAKFQYPARSDFTLTISIT